MSSHNVYQLQETLINALNADSDLMTLCGSDDGETDPRVWGAKPKGEPAFPLICISHQKNPTPGTAPNLFRVSWQIDLMGELDSQLYSILNHLEENWNIPLNRPAGLDSTDLTMQLFSPENVFKPVDVKMTDNGTTRRFLPTLWRSQVKGRS